MAPSIEAAPPPQRQQNVRRSVPTTMIVPAIPLSFMKKRKDDGSARNQKMSGKQHVNDHANGVTTLDVLDEPTPSAVNSMHAVESPKRERRRESLRVVTQIPESLKDLAIDGDSKQDQEPRTEMGPPNSAEHHSFEPFANDGQHHHPLNAPEYQPVPSSAGSGPFSYHPSHMGHVFVPQAHPLNGGNIVFGGYSETTTPSPAPTQYMVDMQHYYPLYPQQMDDKYPTQHETDPWMLQQMYLPMNGAAPMPHPNYFSRYDPNFPPPEHGHGLTQSPERNMSLGVFEGYSQIGDGIGSPTSGDYSQGGPDMSQDGIISSASERDGAILSEDPQHDVRVSQEQSVSSMENSTFRFPQHPQTEVSTRNELSEPEPILQAHMLSYFDNQEYADCVLEIWHESDRFEPITVPAHRILLSRSSLLKSRLEATQDVSPTKVVRVETTDRFLTVWSISRVLHHLYGAGIEEVFDRFALYGKSLNNTADTVDGILAAAAAGNLFQLPHIVAQAVQMASEIITWENLEQIFAFALEGGYDEEWMKLNNLNQKGHHTLEALAKNAGVTHDSNDGSPDVTKQATEKGKPIYGVYALRLLDTAMRFITENFSRDFVFDSTVSSLPSVLLARLPDQTEKRLEQQSDPRLSSMKFGDYPSEDDNAQSAHPSSSVLSQLLVSLPFPWVKKILESKDLGGMNPLAPGARGKIARAVIHEREQRRRKVLRTSKVSYEERLHKMNEWEVVGWEEYVVKMHHDREVFIRLERNWRGIQGHPSSSFSSSTRPRTKQTKK
ncbi:MAG: hypothetical protein M1816_000651 [Peltula sp. TS41687]|nr:MAG: hypothetical protein M1816_000651 [Peltula sp. TS41687]